ncbi:MAG: cation:proton antiporter [Rhodospirillaceae bacterium]|jgi:glutathione-regulated potassium-efflux system ancillary protein KefC
MDHSLIVVLVLVGTAAVAFEVGISSAILEILAGILLAVFIVDLPTLDWLSFLANLGMLTLMFLVGFEVDVDRLRETWRTSVIVGVCALAAPMAGVLAVGLCWLDLAPKTAGLLAIGLSTTSLALVYQVLRERGMLSTPSGQVILAAASVVDVLSMILLALVMGDVGWGTAIFLIVVVPTVLGLPRLGKWIFRRYKGSLVEFELRFLLVILIGLGVMAEKIGGLHPAIVAFALGVIMSEVMEEHEELEQKLKGVVFSLFAPVFFLHAGLQIDVRLLTPELFGIVAVLLVVAWGLKYVGAAVPFRLLMKEPGHIAGLVFNYRLSFGVITATVGLHSGILGEDLYAVILMVIVGSAVVPALLLRQKPAEID